ncbi:MAG TPA: hypothetical protein PKC39_14330 [Ferruginibacter sp.]|nr:hypothetical protein [Ferruginibacter sp.]HMP22132.1 hypothetical protein [Ferruginibacter sp.]
MSLNNITLPPNTICQLYTKVLVEAPTPVPTLQKQTDTNFVFLGKNKKHITIAVNNPAVLHLPDDELSFLMGILAACKLTIEDVAILNLAKNNPCNYQDIATRLGAVQVLLFGIKPGNIDLPLDFPPYQVQRYNQQGYLAAPALSLLQNDKAEKIKLWNSLKIMFSL